MRIITSSFKHVLTCGAVAGLLACEAGTKHDIGDVGALGAQLSDYEGTWDGYVEAYLFSDGKDRVRIALNDRGEGVIEVGDSDPLPPPDPEKGYPPFEDDRQQTVAAFEPADNALSPGFEYPITNATVENARIRFEVDAFALYDEWCAGIEPVLWVPTGGGESDYACLPNADHGSAERDGEQHCFLGDETIDCGLFQCQTVCRCDADACEARPNVNIGFDGSLENGNLVGTLVLGERITARLTQK